MNLIRLPLEGTTNTRDIGGYIGTDKKVVKWNKLLRSDGLSNLTDWDQKFLKSRYNLKKVIDLRTKVEIAQAPNIDYSKVDITYVNIPLADEYDPNRPKITETLKLDGRFLVNLYIDILDNKQSNLKKVVEEIFDVEDDEAVLFHCTAGKDRTGVVAMLLLGICGVTKQDIVTNYMQTEVNLKYNEEFNKHMKSLNSGLPQDFVKSLKKSEAEFIEYTYDYLIEKYESFEKYFEVLGFSEEYILKLKNELMVDID